MNKKAIAESALITIILALAVGIVLTGGIIRYNQTVKKESPIDICRANAILSANSKQFIPLSKCETIVTELDVDKKAPQSVQKTQAMRSYAKLIGDCWYEMGEGKLNLFKGDVFGTEEVCYVCFQFTSPVEFTATEFGEWLSTQSKDFEANIKETTFWNGRKPSYFITKFESDAYWANYTAPLVVNEPYSIIYISVSDERLTQIFDWKSVGKAGYNGAVITVANSDLPDIKCTPMFINIKE